MKLFFDCLNYISPLLTALATVAIAWLSYKSNTISNRMQEISSQMRKISKEQLDLSKKIDSENKLRKDNTDTIFWAMIFSTIIASDPSGRKSRMGFLLKVFEGKNIFSQTGIDPKTLSDAVNANCNKYFDDEIKKNLS